MSKRIRRSAAETEAAFRARVTELGGTVAGAYVNTITPVSARCRLGHPCNPRPGNVLTGRGICNVCAGRCPEKAEAAFRTRVAELGGTIVGQYAGAFTAVEVTCQNGHTNFNRPSNLRSGQGLCSQCRGIDKASAENRFRTAVADQGGTVVGPYKTARTPVEIRCSEGHAGFPHPGSVTSGRGICATCHAEHTVVYVVLDSRTDTVKFGITSGDGRSRVGQHRRAGFTEALRVFTDLPEGAARDIENLIKADLRAASLESVRGTEYFRASLALTRILRLVDSHPLLAT